VLQNVSFSVTEQAVAIIGRNGMGKSTLCAAIMGMTPPRTSGSVRLEGTELIGRASYKIAGLGIGYVPQGRRLFPSLSVEEGLRMLLVEQNLVVATSLAERQLVMIGGEIAAETTASELAGSVELQRRYLGVEPVAH